MAGTELQREALLMLRPVPTVQSRRTALTSVIPGKNDLLYKSVETQTIEEIASQTEVQQAMQELTERCSRLLNTKLEKLHQIITYKDKEILQLQEKTKSHARCMVTEDVVQDGVASQSGHKQRVDEALLGPAPLPDHSQSASVQPTKDVPWPYSRPKPCFDRFVPPAKPFRKDFPPHLAKFAELWPHKSAENIEKDLRAAIGIRSGTRDPLATVWEPMVQQANCKSIYKRVKAVFDLKQDSDVDELIKDTLRSAGKT